MRKLILLITLIFLALLASDLYPGLRGGSGWRWPYLLPDNWTGALVLGILLIVYLVGVFLLRRWQARTWAFISAAVLGVAVVGVHGDAGFLLFTRTVSPVQTGASALAVRVMAEVRDALGYATTAEQDIGVNLQRFEGGTLFKDVTVGQVFVLLVDGRAFGPYSQ